MPEDIRGNEMDSQSGQTRRKRRKTRELRSDILTAAQEVFSEKGYAATSTREIADRANAAERLIYQHFENKATLFAAAVFDPVERTLDEELSESKIPLMDAMSPTDGVRHFVEFVLRAIRRNKRLFIVYLNALTFHQAEFNHLKDRHSPASFEARLVHLESLASVDSKFVFRDQHFEVRLVLLFLASVALFDDIFFASFEQNAEREIQSIVKLLTIGMGAKISSADAAEGSATAREAALAQENHDLRMLLSDAMLELRAFQKTK